MNAPHSDHPPWAIDVYMVGRVDGRVGSREIGALPTVYIATD
jgi:hypothetical protein